MITTFQFVFELLKIIFIGHCRLDKFWVTEDYWGKILDNLAMVSWTVVKEMFYKSPDASSHKTSRFIIVWHQI